MRFFVTTLALCAVLGTTAGQAAEGHRPTTHAARMQAAQVTCGALSGVPSRIAYAAPEASACCAQDPACARLLATTVIRRARSDLHT